MSGDKTFLGLIAEYYVGKGSRTLADYTFVTPNKRASKFLRQHIRNNIHGANPVMMPRFVTFSRLLTHFAGFSEGSRNELLFTLYEAVREVYTSAGRPEGVGSFESFIFWGDMMLSDFNEIDSSLADASALFKNIRHIKEIQSDFLDKDQKELVRRLWGESRLTRESDMLGNGESSFWLHLSVDQNADSLRNNFKTLWDLQGEIYAVFHRKLRERNIGTSGSTARAAWKHVKNLSPDSLTDSSRFVFVGFGDPSTVETLVMKRLHDLGIADFFWDISRTLQLIGEQGPSNKAISRIAALARELKEPFDFNKPDTPLGKKEIEVIAAPSKVAQAKAVHKILKDWLADGNIIDTANPLNTAIVLPDENLLMPVLFSLPEEIEAVNITMGVPYSSTTFAKLLESIIMMQRRSHKSGGETSFFYEDVVSVLGHPHIRLICGETTDKVLKRISDEHVFNVLPELVREVNEDLARIVFQPVSGYDAVQVAEYLTNLIDWLSSGLDKSSGNSGKILETKLLNSFRKEVRDILDLAIASGVEMTEKSFFILLDRMFSTAQTPVSGTPLKGLQIMGVLETRALDFENVIILSMNEGTYPRKQYGKTMIPNILRMDYGLPELNAGEGVYAYCFYRLIAGAKRVSLLYDSRTGVNGSGEESRYISQLRFLLPELEMKTRQMILPAGAGSGRVITVEKTDDVRRALEQFKAGGSKYISASGLKTYLACPLQFYLSYVAGLRADSEIVRYITNAEYGSIFHRVFQNLYHDFEGREVRSADIARWLADPEKYIRPLIDAAIFEFRHPRKFKEERPAPPQTSEEQTIASAIFRMIQELLRQEIPHFTPDGTGFVYVEGEKEVKGPWQVSPDLAVNFKMYIDRVDRPTPDALRFIDYKTGSDANAVLVERLTDPTYSTNSGAAFQLLTYCEAYKDMADFDGSITPLIYRIRNAFSGQALDPIYCGSGKDKVELADFRSVSPVFRPMLQQLVEEIFDPSVPFAQCPESKGCSPFCPFLALCGRKAKSF
ncbi:MAG: PD-(D/E)XK nuclease family protein [Muribaculaceae bacterium]|nr:PD-(D/E)XK nuclease family protein [Muribaculaceae bacterium]